MSQPLLDLMLDAARAASSAIMDVYLTDFEHVSKSDGSPVTVADQRAETVILEKLRHTGIPVLAEESAAAGIVPLLGDRFFVVDPLDGTKEFLKRNGVPSRQSTDPPADSRIAWPAAVSHSEVGVKRG